MVLTYSKQTAPQKAINFTLLDVNDEKYKTYDQLKKEVTVIMFICNHCPFVKHIKEKIKEVHNQYKGKVSFIAINSNDPNYNPEDNPEKMKQEGYQFPYLFDETQEVAKQYGAECTPEFYVYKNDQLMYHGRFDESTPGNNKKVTGEDLITAIENALNNQKTKSKPSMGCNIKWKQK